MVSVPGRFEIGYYECEKGFGSIFAEERIQSVRFKMAPLFFELTRQDENNIAD